MTITKNTPAVLFSGKGKAARESAMLQIAPLSFSEETSRGASVENMRKVLGAAPSEALVAAAKNEWVIGYVAARLPASELPRGRTSPDDRLTTARDIVLHKARPAEEGKRANKLRAGQTGRRSPVQQRIVQNALKACSLFFAELNLSQAQTQKAKNAKAAAKATRAPSMAGSGKGKAAAPSHSELVAKPAAPVSADDVLAFLGQQSRMLQDYVNRHAKVTPTDASAAVAAFRKAVIAAANALQERKAIADASKGATNVAPIAKAKRTRAKA